MQRKTEYTPRRENQRLPTNLAIGLSHSGAMAGCRVAFSIVALQLGAAPWLAGVVMALFSAVPALAAVNLGRWMDRIGAFPVLALAGLLSFAALGQTVYFHSLTSMLVAAPFIGTAAIVSHIATARNLGAVDDMVIRARNLSYLGATYSLSHFLGPFIAGSVLEVYGSQTAFLAVALMPATALALTLWERRYYDAGHPATPESNAPSKNSILDLLRMPDLRRWLISNGNCTTAITLFPFVASVHAKNIGLNAAATGWLIADAAIGAVVVRTTIHWVTHRVQPQATLAYSLLGTSVAFACFPFITHLAGLTVLSILLGVAIGAGSPIATTLAYSAAPGPRKSEALGLSMSISMLLQTISPLLLGLVASIWGVTAMASAIAVLLVIAAAYAYSPGKQNK